MLTLLVFFLLLPLAAAAKSALVYYGDDLSWNMAGVHDYIIVQPEHVATDTHGFRTYGERVYAYVSIGEAEPSKAHFTRIDPAWLFGENSTWQSRIADLSNPNYRRFLLEEVMAPLREKGFRNFFFDTLDAYRQLDPALWQAQEAGLIELINAAHRRFPGMRIVLNRGFEIIDAVADSVDAILFESYYYGLNKQLEYTALSDSDRQWLDTMLAPVRAHGLDIIAVDYLDDPHGSEARRNVSALAAKGFIPYIADKHLMRYGLSSREAVKREILALYDSDLYPAHYQGVHQYGSLPLEYLGYVPILKDFRHSPLPDHPEDRYAGVLLWMESGYPRPAELFEWVRRNARHGLHTLFFRGFGTENLSQYLPLLQIAVKPGSTLYNVERTITLKSAMLDFEAPVRIMPHPWLLQPNDALALLRYSENGIDSVLAAITPWGGYAVGESSMIAFGEDNLWVIDPFKLFVRALRLPPLPVPDPTTENGRRLLFTHIDGDGIMNRAEWDPSRLSGEVIYEKILRRYPIPHSVSFVEGEIAPSGLFPDDSARFMRLGREILSLPNVEGATHTYSHPFIWGKVEPDALDPAFRLDIPGYHFTLERDILGSLDFVNRELLPKGRAKARSVFWSGDCLPTEAVLRFVYARDLLNINGGDTTITRDRPWLYNIAPLGIRKGDYYQIYTGAQNENVYTNKFHGPFWGFGKVIQTFEMTDSPRRFKPIDIYYHFYSGSKTASLKALESVFDWAMKQESLPVYTSEYIYKAMEFYDAAIAQEENTWHFFGMHHLRTVRLDDTLSGGIDLERSPGVVSITGGPEHRHVSFDGEGDCALTLSKQAAPDTPYLLSANGAVREHEGNSMLLRAHVPLQTRWHLPEGCRIDARPAADIRRRQRHELILEYLEATQAVFYERCE